MSCPIMRYFLNTYMKSRGSSWEEHFQHMIFYYPSLPLPKRHMALLNEIRHHPGATILVIRFPGTKLEHDALYYQLKDGQPWNGWLPKQIWVYV